MTKKQIFLREKIEGQKLAMILSMYTPVHALSTSVKTENVINHIKTTNSDTNRQEQVRKAVRKYRLTRKSKLSYLFATMWSLFPRGGLDKVKANCLCDTNINCGGHQLSLAFDLAEECPLENRVIGTRSLGLRCENEHSVWHWNRERCLFSEANIDFLNATHASIHLQFPPLRHMTTDYMRVNLVAGAVTSAHTDTMRGATPNFFMVEKPANDNTTPFCLQVRMFPNFKTSIVKLDGKLFIPHKQKRSHLILIGLKDDKPHYYVYPTNYIERLEPYGALSGAIVVGIKNGKLQTMSDQCKVHQTTREMELITFQEAVDIATKHPEDKPKKLFRYLSKPEVWHHFVGWKNSHQLLPGCDHRLRRIHVFYRPVREETAAARLRTKKSNEAPLNYTFMAGATPDKH